MQIGIVGLGRMGANIGRRLMKHGHRMVGFDANQAAVKALEGATPRRVAGRCGQGSWLRRGPSG